MNPRDFCYWLQGFFEISKSNQLSDIQVEEIKNHLQLVFKKETPSISISEEVKPFEFPTKVWCGPHRVLNDSWDYHSIQFHKSPINDNIVPTGIISNASTIHDCHFPDIIGSC